MKYEFHAQYPLATKDDVTQAVSIDFIVGKRSQPTPSWPELAAGVGDDWTRLSLLAQTMVTAYKAQARTGTRRDSGGYKYWLEEHSRDFLQKQRQMMETLGLLPSFRDVDLTAFPPNAWVIHFTFTLRKPYISRDDDDFYILDNPLKKEWVFKLPYVAPSQWKGALRAAMMQELVAQLRSGSIKEQTFTEKRLELYRIFGNEKDRTAEFLNRAHCMDPLDKDAGEDAKRAWQKKCERTIAKVGKEFEALLRTRRYRIGDTEGFQGRLHFYPTYFDQIGLEVINPHSRQTSAGQHPIYFECVPIGAEGTFALLYAPLDGASERQALADLAAVAQGIQAMLTRYGFGAKTSSGFGVAQDQLVGEGKLGIRAELAGKIDPALASRESEDGESRQLQADIEGFIKRFNLDSFPRRTNTELSQSGWGKKRQSEYKRLRNRHPDWNANVGTWREPNENVVIEKEQIEPPSVTERTFRALSKLYDLADEVRAGGEV